MLHISAKALLSAGILDFLYPFDQRLPNPILRGDFTRRLIKFNLRAPHLHHPSLGPGDAIIIRSRGHVLCKICSSKISRLRLLSLSNPTLPLHTSLVSRGVEVALSIFGIWLRENYTGGDIEFGLSGMFMQCAVSSVYTK